MKSLLRRHISIAEWLPSYNPAWLSKDAVAAISVWALIVPQAIAYASVAGLPPQYGLYATIGGLTGYALFGTSRQVITGPSATVAAVSASAVGIIAASGSSNPEAKQIPGILVADISGPLSFADTSNFRHSVLEMAELNRPRALVVDLSAAATIDLDGADVLTRAHGELAKKNVKLILAHLGDEHLDLLEGPGRSRQSASRTCFRPCAAPSAR